MKLGEKIALLRKERHWSQEELAMRLDISRQSVSKWESDASIPDLDKVVRLSEIFDVSIDFLLKEEIPSPDAGSFREGTMEGAARQEPENLPIRLTEEEADSFLDLTERSFKRIALGVTLCILSPIAVILLAGLAEYGVIPLGEDQAGGIGLIVLFLFVGAAVALFILYGMQLEKYEYLEKELVELPVDCREKVELRRQEFEPTFRGCITAGVVLCVMSVLPILVASAFGAGDVVYLFAVGFLLFIVAFGVYPIVWSAGIWGSFEKLLQTGDYTAAKKRDNKRNEKISGIYWGIVVAIYLAVSFSTMSWHRTWIIWPCAGVLYAVVCGIFNLNSGE